MNVNTAIKHPTMPQVSEAFSCFPPELLETLAMLATQYVGFRAGSDFDEVLCDVMPINLTHEHVKPTYLNSADIGDNPDEPVSVAAFTVTAPGVEQPMRIVLYKGDANTSLRNVQFWDAMDKSIVDLVVAVQNAAATLKPICTALKAAGINLPNLIRDKDDMMDNAPAGMVGVEYASAAPMARTFEGMHPLFALNQISPLLATLAENLNTSRLDEYYKSKPLILCGSRNQCTPEPDQVVLAFISAPYGKQEG